MIDAETFVKSVLACLWMSNDLPRNMRKDLHSQLGLIWLLLTESKCFPSIQFTKTQQKAICKALEQSADQSRGNFKFTYEELVKYEHHKVKENDDEVADDDDVAAIGQQEQAKSSSSVEEHDGVVVDVDS